MLGTWPNKGSVSQRGPWKAVSASPANLLEMHIHRPHPRPSESGILEWGPVTCVLTSLPGSSHATEV